MEEMSRMSSHGTEDQWVLLHVLLLWNTILLRLWRQGDTEHRSFADFS